MDRLCHLEYSKIMYHLNDSSYRMQRRIKIDLHKKFFKPMWRFK